MPWKGLIGFLVAPLLSVAAAVAAAAGPEQPQLIVSYVEVPVTDALAARRALAGFAEQIRKDPVAPVVEVLSEIGRPNRLAVVERWPAAAPDSVAAALQRRLEGKLQAPVDRRVHHQLVPLVPGRAAPFHMLMHLDVVPAGAELAARLVQAQGSAVLAAPGALAFEAATQADRANHFALHEVWASRAAYEADAASPAAEALRRELAAVKGALFDDRFYVVVGAPR